VAKAQFKLTGLITDAPTGKNAVGATLAVTDGPDAGRSVQSEGNARYTFDALTEGTFTIKVTHPGYTDLTRPVTLASDLSFDLAISAVLDLSLNYGTFAVSLTLVSDTCEFPPGPGSSGTIRLSGSADGSVFSFVITERGTTRTYSGSMDPDGSFTGKGSGLFAGSKPLVRLVRHDFTGRVSGRVGGRNIDGSENVTCGDPCPGRTLELSFSGSK
jgi:Carboxypeptidase regulatory-like domain